MFNQQIKSRQADDDEGILGSGADSEEDEGMNDHFKKRKVSVANHQANPANFSTAQVSETQPSFKIYENPAAPSAREKHLDEIMHVLSSRECYFYKIEHGVHNAKRLQRTFSNMRKSTALNFTLEYPPYERLDVSLMLGQGGYGSVYLAKDTENELVAAKVEESHIPWEYFILYRVHERLAGTRASMSIISPLKMFQLEREQILVLNYMPQGTLLDLVNNERSKTNKMGIGEQLVIYFTIELLRTVEALHRNNIIHGDIKGDNIMLRLGETLQSSHWTEQYHSSGDGLWCEYGLTLLDFGKGIDMTMYEPGTKFTSDWNVDEEDCQEMHKCAPWSYEADYHGMATVIYLLLFGQKIKTKSSARGLQVAEPFKRYWHIDLWTNLFDCLLNSGRYAKEHHLALPMVDTIKSLRQELESVLSKECRGLKAKLAELYQYKAHRT